MTAQMRVVAQVPLYSAAEWRASQVFRAQYRHDRDLFCEGERPRLRFLRWLKRTGRSMP